MTFESAAAAMNDIAQKMTGIAAANKAGNMASQAITRHIYQGEGMQPLSAATVAYRGAGKPLQDTAALRDSITYSVNGNSASVGTNKIYAPIQNNGGTIRAKKNWLFIPAAGTRQLQRAYGYTPTQVLNGLKNSGHYVYRAGRTICYRRRGGKDAGKVVFYLKKSVIIPARRFFFLSEAEINAIIDEVINDIL